MVEDISESKGFVEADVMVAAVNGEYSDKISTSHYQLLGNNINSMCSLPKYTRPEQRIKQANRLFVKQASISEVSRNSSIR